MIELLSIFLTQTTLGAGIVVAASLGFVYGLILFLWDMKYQNKK